LRKRCFVAPYFYVVIIETRSLLLWFRVPLGSNHMNISSHLHHSNVPPSTESQLKRNFEPLTRDFVIVCIVVLLAMVIVGVVSRQVDQLRKRQSTAANEIND
jgi:hypothetical protein